MGAWRHAALRRSKALRASCGKSRCSDFLSLFSPLVKSYRGAVILGEPLDKMPIVTNKFNKRLNLSISIWRRTLGDGLQILLGGEYPSFTHVMGQIINLGLEHLAFGRFQLETMFSKSVKNYTHPFQVLLLSSGENYYVI